MDWQALRELELCDGIRPIWVPCHGKPRVANGSRLSTWGGSVVVDEHDTYHMVASEMTHSCGINTWLSNSQVVHATCDSPDGAFERSADPVISGLFSHEPKVVRAPDTGQFVVYLTNTYPPITERYPCLSCHDGATDPHKCDFGVNYTDGLPLTPSRLMHTLHGDDWSHWSEMREIATPTPWLDANLDCALFANGSAVCLGRSAINGSDLSGYFVQRARDWKDNASYATQNITENVLRIAGMHCCGEDPFVWFDARYGVLHAVWHYNNETDFALPFGIHTFSVDGGWQWNAFLEFDAYPPEYAYGPHVDFVDAESVDLYRCERPKLVIAADGHTLLALTNGAQPSKNDDYTFTLLRPLKQ